MECLSSCVLVHFVGGLLSRWVGGNSPQGSTLESLLTSLCQDFATRDCYRLGSESGHDHDVLGRDHGHGHGHVVVVWSWSWRVGCLMV